jgi:hypothetical protein
LRANRILAGADNLLKKALQIEPENKDAQDHGAMIKAQGNQ